MPRPWCGPACPVYKPSSEPAPASSHPHWPSGQVPLCLWLHVTPSPPNSAPKHLGGPADGTRPRSRAYPSFSLPPPSSLPPRRTEYRPSLGKSLLLSLFSTICLPTPTSFLFQLSLPLPRALAFVPKAWKQCLCFMPCHKPPVKRKHRVSCYLLEQKGRDRGNTGLPSW